MIDLSNIGRNLVFKSKQMTEIGSSCNMSNWGGFLLPPFSHAGNDQGSRQGYVDPFGGRTKKVVRIPIE